MIELRGVSYAYPGAAAPALCRVDLTVPDGQWLLVAGPSGCGKSTLLYLLNGLVPHVLGGQPQGEIRVDGLTPGNVPVGQWSRRVGTVFQNPETQLFMLRVEEDVAFGCQNLGLPAAETRRRVDEALERMSLGPIRGREVSKLSGGQKQRLAIAGALAMGCQTLLLDEPTSDLDDTGRGELLAALDNLRRGGHTIIMTEHRFQGLAGLVDRVVTMEDGRIVSDGPLPPPEPCHRCRRPTACRLDGPAVVEIHDATFSYDRGRPVLDGMSLAARAGEVVALHGPNGCGKTTLLKLLSGLLRCGGGSVRIAGMDNPTLRRLVGKVGLLLQNPDEQLFTATAIEEVAFGPRNLGQPVDAVGWLDRVGLGRYADAHPASLSRGERKRLAAAAVLAMRPEVILLDEPTTGLDRRAWTALMDVVVDQARECGAAVLFSTHHAEVTAAFANRELLIREGKLVDDRVL